MDTPALPFLQSSKTNFVPAAFFPEASIASTPCLVTTLPVLLLITITDGTVDAESILFLKQQYVGLETARHACTKKKNASF